MHFGLFCNPIFSRFFFCTHVFIILSLYSVFAQVYVFIITVCLFLKCMLHAYWVMYLYILNCLLPTATQIQVGGISSKIYNNRLRLFIVLATSHQKYRKYKTSAVFYTENMHNMHNTNWYIIIQVNQIRPICLKFTLLHLSNNV